MRAGKQERTATAGESAVVTQFEKLEWGVSRNPDHDLGTDLWLMARDRRRFDLGLLVGAQVKTSDDPGPASKYFKEPVRDETGEVTGWWFRESEQKHFKYWLQHSVPHIVVLHDLKEGISYWAHITDESVEWTTKGAKIFVSRSQTVDGANADGLLAIATSQRSPSGWEGSAWTGASHVLPDDRLRHALIAPRLIAPHPNTTPVEVTPAQAIAMLVQCRLNELDGHREVDELIYKRKSPYPSVEDAHASTDWEWRLYAALHAYLHHGDPSAFDATIEDAESAAHRTAATILAASALLENGKAEAALALVETTLALDEDAPADNAWLQVQKARSLRELGRMKEARDAAIDGQRLRAGAPYDPTAMAIAAAATQLVFATTGFEARDIAQMITDSDTAAGWWRSQVTAWGLDKKSEESFKKWAQDTSVTYGAANTAWQHLRAASLMCGFAGDHAGWRHALSLLARFELETSDRHSPIERTASLLTDLRLSGDDTNLKLAVSRIVSTGPAGAASQAGAEVDLERSTMTSSKSDITLVTTAADVLGMEVADRHAQWALNTLDDPSGFVERVRPTYFVTMYVLDMVTALVPAVSPKMRRQILDHLVGLPPQPDQSLAHSYASLVRAFDSEEWSPEDIQQVAIRTKEDNWELADAFTSLQAERDQASRDKLIDDMLAGSLRALGSWGDVRSLPAEVVTALIETLTAKVNKQIADARENSWGIGSEPGRELTLLNMWHHGQADWEPVRELLNEPASHPGHIIGTLQLLIRMPERLPPDIAASFKPVLRAIQAREPDRRRLLFSAGGGQNLQAVAGEALEALAPGTVGDTDLWGYMAGDAEQRRSLARILSRRRDPTELNLLAGLAFDRDCSVRSTAAYCIARWAAEGIATPASQTLLLTLLDDPGTRLAKNVAGALENATDRTRIAEVLQKLRMHASAIVRHQATRAVEEHGRT